jgi:Uma2 family endonuclease
MALPAKKKILSISEYFEMEEKAEIRHEYYKGEIFAFAGASINHGRIIGNINAKLLQKLNKKKCEPFSNDLKVHIDEFDFFTYPDILVICDKPEFYKDRDDTVLNPVLIIEVLSESTKNYDRGDKFEFYRTIKSLQDYVLIDQYRVHMEHFEKNKDGKWLLTEYSDTSPSLELSHLNLEIPLKEIYERVEFK